MNYQFEQFNAQTRALRSYLKLHHGFPLDHGACLKAVAAIHGYLDAHEMLEAANDPQRMCNASIECPSLTRAASNLAEHILREYGISLAGPTDAIAAMRRGTIVDDLERIFGDALTVKHWLQRPRSSFYGLSADEILETDAGYGLVQSTLSTLI